MSIETVRILWAEVRRLRSAGRDSDAADLLLGYLAVRAGKHVCRIGERSSYAG